MQTTRVQQTLQSMTESTNGDQQDNSERNTTAYPPKVTFAPRRVDNAGKIHAVVRREKRKGEEDNGDAGEDKNGLILRIGDDC